MNPPLYNQVHEIVLNIVNASECNDTKLEWKSYQELMALCKNNEKSDFNHPFQWETLGDFTHSTQEAIKIYDKALKYAKDKKLIEYEASILFSLAESYYESKDFKKSLEFANKANKVAKETNDLDLRKEISEFLLHKTKNT